VTICSTIIESPGNENMRVSNGPPLSAVEYRRTHVLGADPAILRW
jgi:hypothetical protein